MQHGQTLDGLRVVNLRCRYGSAKAGCRRPQIAIPLGQLME
jgi:hypothetical protein